jgi:CDP-diacylglycerol--glycerol-3-phosphate 3-phosphatidyltransferase/cardiolipin synthase
MLNINTIIENKVNIPNVISVFRLVSSPFLFLLLILEANLITFFFFLFSSFSDLLDGYIARNLNQCTSFGGYLDIFGDFLLIFSSILGLILKGIYPLWILFLVLFMFLQFIVSSSLVDELIYDPLGKYYGAFLMLMVFLTLIDFHRIHHHIIPISIFTYTLICLSTRALFLFKIFKDKSTIK